MKDETFKEIGDRLFEIVDNIVREGGEVMPVTLLFRVKADKVDGLNVVGTPYSSDDGKNVVMKFMMDQLKRPEIDAVAHVSEAWMVAVPHESKIDLSERPRPSKDPGKIEVVLVTIIDAHRQALILHKIIREDGKSHLEKGEMQFMGPGDMGRFVKSDQDRGPLH